jgi:signal transduction histidine kinase
MPPAYIALLAGPAILLPLACYGFARRDVRGARWYSLLLLSIAFWSVSYAWELYAVRPEVKVLALKTKYLGVVLLPPGWVGFILAFVGSPPARVWRGVLPVALVSALMLAFAWTDAWHGMFWGPITIDHVGGYLVVHGRGPLFWVNVLYTYVILITGIAVLVVHAVHSPYLYKKRARLLIVGTIVPWAGNVTFVMNHQETIIDPTPFLFSCTAVIAALAVFRYDLFEPVPTLRDARIESVADGVIILDRRWRVADLNRAAEEILGRSRSEVAGVWAVGLLPGWPGPSTTPPAIDVTFGSGTDVRTYDVRCSQVRSRAGEVTGAVIVLRDVTERRLAERALRASEQRYRTVFEQAFDGMWLADRDTTILEVNPGACAMLGFSPEELIGRRASDLVHAETSLGALLAGGRAPNNSEVDIAEHQPVGQGVALGPRRQTQQVFKPSHGGQAEWIGRLVSKDGRAMLLAGRSRGIAPDLILSTFRDITQERAEAADRERLLGEAQAANRLKDEFLATLSHELRTPLTAVLGWTHMLVQRAVKPEHVDHALRVIERNAVAQARLVDDLLDISTIAGGRLRLKLAETDVRAVVRDAVEAVAPSAHAKSIVVEVHSPPDVPPIVADPERLRQVIWNLLTNAIKFTPAGGRVRVSAASTPTGLELAVRDTGRGILPEFLPFVFDPFRQAESGSTRAVTGLGLGLAIVHRIVEAHGGRVAAASDGLGRGATFTVYLPVRVGADMVAECDS